MYKIIFRKLNFDTLEIRRGFVGRLSEALAPIKLYSRLTTLNAKNKFSEADNVLRAVQELYRFIIPEDAQGWFGFVRELWNCYSKLANSSDKRERSRSKDYIGNCAKILQKFKLNIINDIKVIIKMRKIAIAGDLKNLNSHIRKIIEKPEIKDSYYYLADTRILHVKLYDHLILTSGIAVAMIKELLGRGCTPSEICGVNIERNELIYLTQICALSHDLGKIKGVDTEYRMHVERSVEYVKSILKEMKVSKELSEIIINSVYKHHLENKPKTPFEKVICLADSYASAGDRPELARAKTSEEFQKIGQNILKLEKEVFGNKKPICLILGDVDAIKSYVYETSKLPEIRGSSQILVELEKEIRKEFKEELTEDCLIYCGGGSFLAIVPASEAEKWKRKIENLYLQKTEICTITIVTSNPLGYENFARGLEPYDDESVENINGSGVAEDIILSHFAIFKRRSDRKGFGELVAKLTANLQLEKRKKEIAPFFPALPIFHRCDSCGKRPASKLDQSVDPPEWLCKICWNKRNEGRKDKLYFANEFINWYKKRYGQLYCLPHENLDELAKLDKRGHIAFLYADGNNIGDLLQMAKTPAAYRHISEALRVAVKEALFEAIIETIGKERVEREKRLPFEIIAIGGDDVSIIIPACYGWDLAINLLRIFENHQKIKALVSEFKNYLGEDFRITMSVGLVIADVKYPVLFMQKLSESLLKEAKRLAKETKQSSICHLWLKSPTISEDAKIIIESLYHKRVGRKEIELTARPYTLNQAIKLRRDIIQLLKYLPSSQRKSLAQVASEGVDVSINFALWQLARMKNKKIRELLYQAFKRLGNLIGQNGNKLLFWSREKNVYRTALLDALELLDLMEG